MSTFTDVPAGQPAEEVFDPTVPIVDAHFHLIEPAGYGVDDWQADTNSGHDIRASVFIDCIRTWDRDAPRHLRPVGESRGAAQVAAEVAKTSGTPMAAIVSHADLRLGEAVEEVLTAHAEAGSGLFRGVRHATVSDEDPELPDAHTGSEPGMLHDPSFRAGFATLGRMGFSFDAWVYSPQLPDLADLAAAHPGTSVVVDHLGGPVTAARWSEDERWKVWRAGIESLVPHPQVVLKLGGIGMHTFGPVAPGRDAGVFTSAGDVPASVAIAAHWGEPIRWAIETLGPDRCLFESNWPVDGGQVGSYVVLWNALQRIADGASPAERTALFSGTASRVYRIDVT